MPEPDHRLVPVPSVQLALASNHLALLNKILPPAVRGPVPGRPWEIPHLGLKLVWIEPGTFLMGYEAENDPEMGPVTQVTISQGYWLATTQVTQMQWETMTGNNPSSRKGATLPVDTVTWKNAMAFCKMLTEQESAAGRLPVDYAFTLPTEAQWEFACRAGTTGEYGGDLDVMAWYDKNSKGTTHPVGTKQPNAWGLYDMHGNVWEWCRDSMVTYQGGAVTNPTGPTTGFLPVFRGGSAESDAALCRSAYRGYVSMAYRKSLGFRLSLSSVG